MKRLLWPLALALAGAGMIAHADGAKVVSSCGGITYDTGGSLPQMPLTQDATGKLCTGAVLSGTGDSNIAQVAGATVKTGAGTASGALRVELPTDGTGKVSAAESGTWTVQPGNTANTTPWLVTLQPTTSGGSSTYSGNITTAGSGAGTGGVAVDASPGQLYGWAIYNANSSVCYIQIFDQTQALTNLGTTTPKISFGIPANGGANVTMPNGIPFATAITAGVTTTRAGSTACSTGLDINLWYK